MRLGDPKIRIRVGLHTGEMVFHNFQETYDVTGANVHLANRMQQMAEDGGDPADRRHLRRGQAIYRSRPARAASRPRPFRAGRGFRTDRAAARAGERVLPTRTAADPILRARQGTRGARDRVGERHAGRGASRRHCRRSRPWQKPPVLRIRRSLPSTGCSRARGPRPGARRGYALPAGARPVAGLFRHQVERTGVHLATASRRPAENPRRLQRRPASDPRVSRDTRSGAQSAEIKSRYAQTAVARLHTAAYPFAAARRSGADHCRRFALDRFREFSTSSRRWSTPSSIRRHSCC